MLRVQSIAMPLDSTMDGLKKVLARSLGVPLGQLQRVQLVRQSIDARKKDRIHYVYTVDVELTGGDQMAKGLRGRNVQVITPRPYHFPQITRKKGSHPVVVGMGPAGLFAALFLARHGLPCILLERGQDVDTRSAHVEQFWRTGVLHPNSNVPFGEGGAGTFSDGKLTTGTHDPRISAVLETLVAAGAPQDVQWSHRPHIGTDILRRVVRNIRKELLSLGCEVRFGHQLIGLDQREDRLSGIQVAGPQGRYAMPCHTLVLAIGHSARDTFAMLARQGVPMEQKSFAIGVRLEQSQEQISKAQYGTLWHQLPPSDYKLACHLPNGRSAFSFCVCPGGQVVAAASAQGEVVTNGMSHRARDGTQINGGLLVGVGPEDFPGKDPLAGIRFQQQWERAAFLLGGETFFAPAQRVEDFLAQRPSQGAGSILPTYQPGVQWGTVDGCLPPVVADTLRMALPEMGDKVKGFTDPDGVLTGVETRSSSPVRILRDGSGQSQLRGLYPCGEGAGYAGGIVSAGVDGIRMAEAIATERGD